MRYTKAALLIFGLGLLVGLMIVSAEVLRWGWVASVVMTLGIALIPVGLAIDARRGFLARAKARLRRRRPRPNKPKPKPALKKPPAASGSARRKRPAKPARRSARGRR